MENLTLKPEEQKVKGVKAQPARGPELQNVKEVIDLYIDGVYNGKVESLKKAFHPQASLFGWNVSDLYMAPIQALFDYIAAMPIPSQTGQPTTFIYTGIKITGKAAVVELTMDNYQGNNFVDYFQLIKVEDDRWYIVSKSFHADPATN